MVLLLFLWQKTPRDSETERNAAQRRWVWKWTTQWVTHRLFCGRGRRVCQKWDPPQILRAQCCPRRQLPEVSPRARRPNSRTASATPTAPSPCSSTRWRWPRIKSEAEWSGHPALWVPCVNFGVRLSILHIAVVGSSAVDWNRKRVASGFVNTGRISFHQFASWCRDWSCNFSVV